MADRGAYWQASFRAGDSFRERSRDHGKPALPAADDAHRCARGEWCASGERTERGDGTHGRLPARTSQVFCAADESIIYGCLEELAGLHSRLAAATLEGLAGEVLIRLPFGPSLPLRVDVDELQRLLVETALSWHERVAARERLSVLDTQETHRKALGARSGELLARSANVLREHLDALLLLPPDVMIRIPSPLMAAITPDARVVGQGAGGTVLVLLSGADAGNEIMRLEYAGRATLLETDPAPEKLLGVACRSCERRSLRRAPRPQHEDDPAYASECSDCGHLMTPLEFKQWTAMNARYWHERVTPAQLAAKADMTEPAAARLLAAVVA